MATRNAELAGGSRGTRVPHRHLAWWRLAWLLLAWPALLHAAQAQSSSLHIERLTQSLTPSEVRTDRGTLPWQPVTESPVRVGEGWLRLTVLGPLPVSRPLYLAMPRRGTAHIEVYLPNRVEPLVSDDYDGPYRADVSTRLHVFEIERLAVGDRLYVRATGMRVALLQPALLSHDALLDRDRLPALLTRVLRILLGLAGATMFGCAILRREGIYLAGGAYLLLWLAFLSANDGSLYTLPGTGWLAALRVTGSWLFGLGATIALTAFARPLLRLPRRTPRLDRLLVALMPAFAVIAITAQLPAMRPWQLPLGNAANALLILDTLALLAAAALAARRGARYAKAFLLAWTPTAASIVVDAMAATRLVDLTQDIGLALIGIAAFGGILFAAIAVDRATLRGRMLAAGAAAQREDASADALDAALQRLCMLAREGVMRRFALLLIHPGEPQPSGEPFRADAHAAALRHTAALLHAELRANDRFGTCGDGVLMALLPDADRTAADAAAERLWTRARHAPLTLVGVDVNVSPSVGSAIGSEFAADPATLRLAAERALQDARQAAAAR